jgi:flagellar protein FliS
VTPTPAPALRAYQERSVQTATPEQLLVMLYDGAIRFLAQATVAMSDGDLERANVRLQRAEAILDELLATLDMDAGQVAERLRDLYLFCRRHLNEARVDKDHEKVDAVVGLLEELRDAFAQIDPDPTGSAA